MAMTREEMQKLASLGRGGDTMLAHINPEEAALLKARGGSGTINPNTGLPEYFGLKSITRAVQNIAAPVVKPLEKAVSQVESNVSNLPGSIENTAKQIASNPIAQVALAYYMPTIASSLAPYMTAVPAAYQTAVASALTSTAVQVAQGVPLETALQNAAVNAAASTGAPKVATYVNSLGASPQVADAITSIGVSAAKTAALGGTKEDIERNMAGALVGSGLTSALVSANTNPDTSRIFGAAAGGAVTGGTPGAIGGVASELGAQSEAERQRLENAKKGMASADGVTSDVGNQLGDVVVTGQKEPTLQDTNIILSDGTIQPKSTTTSTSQPKTTAAEEPKTVEKEPTSTAEEPKAPADQYRPNLFIYSGKSPQTLSQALGTSLGGAPTTGTTTGLTAERGGGEIESKETGKKRQNVWNEESLRLKDALGV